MAVYQKALKLLYVDQLLERMKAEFVIHYDPQVHSSWLLACDFQSLLSAVTYSLCWDRLCDVFTSESSETPYQRALGRVS